MAIVDDILSAGKKADYEYLDVFLKILAGENLTVIHSPRFCTAYCDVENRVIGIPEFATESKDILLLFSAHEVGHALFTPRLRSHKELEALIKNREFFSCLNIVEDIRQEKLLRNSFRGLQRSFLKGYKQLLDRDFFGDLSDPSQLTIADRVNLMGKLAKECPVQVSTYDIAVYRYVRAAKTFSDAIIRAKYLYELVKAEYEGRLLEFADEDESDDGTRENGSGQSKIGANSSDVEKMASAKDIPEDSVFEEGEDTNKSLSDQEINKIFDEMNKVAGEVPRSNGTKTDNAFQGAIEKAKVRDTTNVRAAPLIVPKGVKIHRIRKRLVV